jgi:hypothetical protein
LAGVIRTPALTCAVKSTAAPHIRVNMCVVRVATQFPTAPRAMGTILESCGPVSGKSLLLFGFPVQTCAPYCILATWPCVQSRSPVALLNFLLQSRLGRSDLAWNCLLTLSPNFQPWSPRATRHCILDWSASSLDPRCGRRLLSSDEISRDPEARSRRFNFWLLVHVSRLMPLVHPFRPSGARYLGD